MVDQVCKSLRDEYNDKSLSAVVNRLSEMKVQGDPVLLSVKDGVYAVHDSEGVETWLEDDIRLYSKPQFDEKFGDQKLMTLGQLESDFKAIEKIRGDDNSEYGKFWANHHDRVELRLELITKASEELDVKLDHESGIEKLPNEPTCMM